MRWRARTDHLRTRSVYRGKHAAAGRLVRDSGDAQWRNTAASPHYSQEHEWLRAITSRGGGRKRWNSLTTAAPGELSRCSRKPTTSVTAATTRGTTAPRPDMNSPPLYWSNRARARVRPRRRGRVATPPRQHPGEDSRAAAPNAARRSLRRRPRRPPSRRSRHVGLGHEVSGRRTLSHRMHSRSANEGARCGPFHWLSPRTIGAVALETGVRNISASPSARRCAWRHPPSRAPLPAAALDAPRCLHTVGLRSGVGGIRLVVQPRDPTRRARHIPRARRRDGCVRVRAREASRG